jgi:hypothetical protein
MPEADEAEGEGDEESDAEPAFTMGAEPPAEADATRRGGISVRSVFVFLAVVVCGYGALTWSLLDDPDWAGKLTRDLPIIGSSLRDVSTGDDIALVDVQGRYERTKDGKVVFVVTGKAVNQSAETLRSIQITGLAAGRRRAPTRASGHRLRQRLEAKIRELSVHQVSILRSIAAAGSRHAAGQQRPFVSIFLGPPAASTFTTEVARAALRLGGGSPPGGVLRLRGDVDLVRRHFALKLRIPFPNPGRSPAACQRRR